MITVIKQGNVYNRRVISLEGLSTDTKPVEYFIETDSNGVEVARVYIENGSTFTEIDTGKLFMYDAENNTWYEIETSGGGGSGGTTNYNLLSNKPKINDTELSGNKTSSDLGLQDVISDLETIRSGASAGATAVQPATMNEALGGKQDNLTFDNTPTSGSNNPVKSGGVYTALNDKVDKETGKGLSTNDFSDSEKAQISANKAGIGAVANRGSKNQLDVSQTPSTMNAGNITITKDADGSLTLNGTSTVVSDVIIGRITLPAGDYVLSGCAEGGSGRTWLIRIYGEPNITNASDTVGTVFHTDGITNASVCIVVGGNKTLTNAVFKPMICTKAEWDISQEFVLYAPTNRELYEMILSLQSGT